MNATNDSLRVRITSRCNLNCSFCHDEGGDASCEITMDQVCESIEFARTYGFRKFHLTGGEPTMHSSIVRIVRTITDGGYSCGITTNGQFSPKLLAELKEAGVTSLNFSMHTINPAAWAKVQQHDNLERSTAQIKRAIANMLLSVSLGIRTKVNIVVGENPTSAIEVVDFLKGSGVELRLLNVLGSSESLINISYVLSNYEAEMINEMRVLGSSQYRTAYESKAGSIVVKEIHQYREAVICAGCKENCHEGFYGVRLVPMEDGVYTRLCIHRTCKSTVMQLSQFRSSPQLRAILTSGGLSGGRKEVHYNGDLFKPIPVCGA